MVLTPELEAKQQGKRIGKRYATTREGSVTLSPPDKVRDGDPSGKNAGLR
jgi:hypothetical protein